MGQGGSGLKGREGGAASDREGSETCGLWGGAYKMMEGGSTRDELLCRGEEARAEEAPLRQRGRHLGAEQEQKVR